MSTQKPVLRQPGATGTDSTPSEASEPEQGRSYAAARSHLHRPSLSLRDFRGRHRAQSLQLGWVGLSRPGRD
jgi:hypothetical protein